MFRYPYRLLLCVYLFLGCGNGQRRSAEPPAKPLDQIREAIGSATLGKAAPSSPATPTFGGSPAVPSPPEIAAKAIASGAAPSDGPSTSSSALPQPVSSPVPPLLDARGRPLPQTDELPTFDSPSFQSRIQLLFEAIVKDDPAVAAPAFFPLVAYEQVKDIAQPARDHKFRLLAAFARNIHEYHRLLGKDPYLAKFEGIVPPKVPARWMAPGSEGNRLGYYRLLRASLKVIDASGRPRQLELTSLISWRGQWYVVHLNGFK